MMDYEQSRTTHRVISYYWDSNGELQRFEQENLSHGAAMKLVHYNKHHHNVKVYNYLGQLVHEEKKDPTAPSYA